MNAIRTLTACVVSLTLAHAAFALDWSNTTSSVKAKPGADAVMTSFKFVNHGKALVHVLGVQTSCGCTDATVNPNEIPPGESGTVEVLFTIGDRKGTQQREVFVQADDAPEPTKLTLTVEIPPRADPSAKVAKRADRH
jgi:hypothetical protein